MAAPVVRNIARLCRFHRSYSAKVWLSKNNAEQLLNATARLHHSRSIFSACIPSSSHTFDNAGTLCGTPSLLRHCQTRYGLPFSSATNSAGSAEIQKTEEMADDALYKWIELRVKGHDDAVLESYSRYVSMAADELDVTIESITKPFRHIKRLTLLKSRHVYKKHRVQYEMRTYYRVIKLKHLTGSTADVFLEYIERNLPEGVAMQVKKCSLEQLPEHLRSPPEQLEDDLEMTSSSSSSESESDAEAGSK
ncbi:small ribosomal subunit protein uS10m-like [Diadema antillarum]|uniref:small ribosomal subunit protein uS10m-like n=1 Tax=Diadema antillarum TaxID=105358 RepID=UPI003A84C714